MCIRDRIENISICESGEQKVIKELHIFADEDHVHTQKPNKERLIKENDNKFNKK